MLIESFSPNPDAVETHKIEIAASREAVYQALWITDLGGSPIIKSLMALRSLPGIVSNPKRPRHLPRQITLQTIIERGFGQLAEEPDREVVLGVEGQFWRPTGNILPFSKEFRIKPGHGFDLLLLIQLFPLREFMPPIFGRIHTHGLQRPNRRCQPIDFDA
jgi:hypothetical protein